MKKEAKDINNEELIDQEEKSKTEKKGVKEDKKTDKLNKLKTEVEEAKDKYLRLYSEFDNYKRRNAKERETFIKTAHEDLIVVLLPIVDDFERAEKANSDDKENSSEGVKLIWQKFVKILEQKGLKVMDHEVGSEFNPELHEAVAQIPTQEKKLKGKIIEVIEKGYFLGEKVVRFAKVVIGS